MWTANAGDGSLTRRNPLLPGDRGQRVELGQDAVDVAVGPDAAWVTNASAGTLSRLDPVSGRLLGRIRVGRCPTAVAAGLRQVWVVDSGQGTVVRVDPREELVVGAPIRVGRDPQDVAIGQGYAWVVNRGDGTVTRISLPDRRPGRSRRSAGPAVRAARARRRGRARPDARPPGLDQRRGERDGHPHTRLSARAAPRQHAAR